MCTTGSGVRGSIELVLATNSDRARGLKAAARILILCPDTGQIGRQRLSAVHNDRCGHRLIVDWAPDDNRAIARGSGCASANGSFTPRTPSLGGRSARGSPREEHHPGLPATSVWLRLKFCRWRSAAEPEKTASFDAVGARTPGCIPGAVFLLLVSRDHNLRGELWPKILTFWYCDFGFPTVGGV
eukprot:4436593-Pleurochrysis_carterae.AAC.1